MQLKYIKSNVVVVFFKYLIIKKKYAWYKLNVHQSSKCHCSIIICTLLLCNKITCKIYIISN